MYVPSLVPPFTLRRARPRATLTAFQNACPRACARIPRFLFSNFPRLALSRYQLQFSWHRWLKTASACDPRPAGLGSSGPFDSSACSSHPLPSSCRSWMQEHAVPWEISRIKASPRYDVDGGSGHFCNKRSRDGHGRLPRIPPSRDFFSYLFLSVGDVARDYARQIHGCRVVTAPLSKITI